MGMAELFVVRGRISAECHLVVILPLNEDTISYDRKTFYFFEYRLVLFTLENTVGAIIH
jgi:hypothetical protein